MKVSEETAIRARCGNQDYYFCSEGCRDRYLHEQACRADQKYYDTLIIGGGPAGLTAAVYASTLRLNAFLIAGNLGGQAIDSTKVQNYMGFDFITGPELIRKFEAQLFHSHYIDHWLTEAERIEPVSDGFRVTTSDMTRYHAKTLIVATGMTRRRLGVPGEEEFQRKGIFYGNIQDLAFVHGEDAAVIGGGNSAVQIVRHLGHVARTIHLISDAALTADPAEIETIRTLENLNTYEHHKVLEFHGTGNLEAVIIRKKATKEVVPIRIKGAFVAIGLHPNTSLVSRLVDLNEKGEIVIHADCSTSRPGIFAAGDVTNAYGKRIIVASGEGAKAAMAARQYILESKKERAGETVAPR